MIPVSKYPQNLQDDYPSEISSQSRRETDKLIAQGYTEDENFEDYVYNVVCYNLTLKGLTEAQTAQETGSAAGASVTEREQSDMWWRTLDGYKKERDRLFPMLNQTTSNAQSTPSFQQL